LSHADQNYVRADTHAAANVELILAQGKVPIALAWGGGLLASVMDCGSWCRCGR
jgi:hypothetical protein